MRREGSLEPLDEYNLLLFLGAASRNRRVHAP